jgi:hypothetical protein
MWGLDKRGKKVFAAIVLQTSILHQMDTENRGIY